MATVKVKFFGVIRDVTGAQTTEVEMQDGATVMDLLKELHNRYGQPFYDRVLDEAIGVRTYVRLFINNEELPNNKLDARLVEDGVAAEAMFYVMPAMTGGCFVS